MNGIFNFLQLDENLSCSGMPKPEQLREIAEAGVEFVVNLATPKSEGWMPNEGEVFQSLGVDYLSIRVDWDNPTAQDLSQFMDAMAAHEGQHVHVHCQANFRATAFISLYQTLRLGWNWERAYKTAQEIWDPEEYPIWQKFIEDNRTQADRNQFHSEGWFHFILPDLQSKKPCRKMTPSSQRSFRNDSASKN